MSEVISMSGRDVFVRYTGADGKSHVMSHRVWDAEIFMASRMSEASGLAIEPTLKGKPPGLNQAERITEEQYQLERQA